MMMVVFTDETIRDSKHCWNIQVAVRFIRLVVECGVQLHNLGRVEGIAIRPSG